MPRGAGKGKISNDLVAASCAAVLAVYAAGYSRTREAARKFETQAQERRLALRAQRAAVGGQTPAVKVPAATASVVAALPETSTPVSTPKVRHSSASSAGHGGRKRPNCRSKGGRSGACILRCNAGNCTRPATRRGRECAGPPSLRCLNLPPFRGEVARRHLHRRWRFPARRHRSPRGHQERTHH